MAWTFDWQVIDAHHKTESLALENETQEVRGGTQIRADGSLPW